MVSKIPTTRPTAYNDCEVPSEELQELVHFYMTPAINAMIATARHRGLRLREVLCHASDDLHCAISQEILTDALKYRETKRKTNP